VPDNTDCDDTDASLNPLTVWYRDADSDGFGDGEDSQQSCTQPTGYISDATDCDDTNAGVNPDGSENLQAGTCQDGLDNDCDGTIDLSDLSCLEVEQCAVLGDQTVGDRDFDGFTFSGTQGEMVTVTVRPADGETATGNADVFLIGLEDGTLYSQDRSDLPNGFEVTLPLTGGFRLLVSEPSTGIGGRSFDGGYCVSVDGDQGAGATLVAGPTVEPPPTPTN
jgi:hypothetical protein